MLLASNGIRFTRESSSSFTQPIPTASVTFEESEIQLKLRNLMQPCYAVQVGSEIGMSHEVGNMGNASIAVIEGSLLASVPIVTPEQLGDVDFRNTYGVRYAYHAGAMANGIASTDLVIAMGRSGLLASFGAAGLIPSEVEKAIHAIQQALPQGPYAFNLIHSPSEPLLEQGAVELYLRHGVRTVEASAFLDLTPQVVYYRVAGLQLASQNQILIHNRIIAKVSRTEVASKFMQPAPPKILRSLVEQGLITEQQAQLAAHVPMADDITVEADSGGHTDNRPLVSLLPSILSLRDEIQAQQQYATPVRVGAAGGIGTPMSALAAFVMGAAYVTTGSINQSCVEAGASEHTKGLLAQADMAEVMMAPAADMFEMGVKLQVLKRGTLFPLRAQKLYDLYRNYDSIDDIPTSEREKLEKQVFRKSLDSIWQETVSYFQGRDPKQIERATNHPKRKMALIFRWYLGLSSQWSNRGNPDRKMDYQIWCGPAMGAFNAWTQNSYLAQPAHRKVAEVAYHMMTGAAYLYRINHLKTQGLQLAPAYSTYTPEPV